MKKVLMKVVPLIMVCAMIFMFATPAFGAPNANANANSSTNGNSSNNGNNGNNGNSANSNNKSGNNGNQSDPVTPTTPTAPTSYPLHQYTGHAIGWQGYLEGSDFGISINKGEDKFVPGWDLGTVGTVLWHFVNPDKLGGYANITFVDENAVKHVISDVQSYKNNQHFAVVTPQSWSLLSVEYFPKTLPSTGATQFNLSHTAAKVLPTTGSLAVTAKITAKHELDTIQPVWQKTYQPVWQKTVQPVRQLVFQPVWQKTYKPVWQKTYQPIWQRTYQPSYHFVYKKEVASSDVKTLVSYLGDGFTGGKFGNSHTYVKIDVAAASAVGGINIGIADSSPSNRPIGYTYNVQIANGKLTISFPDSLIKADVGAYVVSDPSQFPGNAPSHHGKTVTVNMPATYQNGIVYLYFHNQGGLSWYTQSASAVRVDDPTVLVSDNWVRDELVSNKFVYDRLIQDEFVRNDQVADNLIFKKVISNEFVRNDFVKAQWLRDEVTTTTVTDTYKGSLNLLVTGINGVVFAGQLANGGTKAISDLAPGVYTCVLSGMGFADMTKTVTVVAGAKATLDFGTITVIGAKATTTLAKIFDEPEYLNKTYIAPVVKDPIYMHNSYLEKTYLQPIYLGRTYLKPIVLDKTYLADNILSAIHNVALDTSN